MRLAKLIAEHGAELAVHLAADCPKAAATNPAERCWVYFPGLAELAWLPPVG